MKTKSIILSAVIATGIFIQSCGKNSGKTAEPSTEPPAFADYGTDTLKGGQSVKTGIFHQKGVKLQSLDIIQGGNLTAEQKVLVATLQGLVAKTSSEQIYIDEGGPSTDWTSYLKSKYGITLNNYASWTDLLSHFKNKVAGYILYNRAGNARSLTAANSLCGPMNAIAVDASLEQDVLTLGITRVKADVRSRDEKWVYTNYQKIFNKQLAAEQNPTINHHLRDYITLGNAFTFYDGNSQWRDQVLSGLNSEAFCMGYGQDEFTMVSNAAKQGVPMLPSDLAANLAPLSSVYDTSGLKQKTFTTPVTEENVHYVTFLVSDGDNLSVDTWTLNNYFKSPVRGTFNMGYTISPSLADLAPSVLSWYYANAANGNAKDFFIAGPSGSGYTYPSQMPVARLDSYLTRLNTLMGAAGLNICNILDQNLSSHMDVWNKYLAQPNIDALIYTGYGEAPTGTILFSANHKPIIAQRDNLWQGLEEEATVISNINSRPANPHSADGYSLVFVHIWTKNLSNIQTVIQGLNPNVRVVTPDAFVKLVKANLK
jgi:hypothetical protein